MAVQLSGGLLGLDSQDVGASLTLGAIAYDLLLLRAKYEPKRDRREQTVFRGMSMVVLASKANYDNSHKF